MELGAAGRGRGFFCLNGRRERAPLPAAAEKRLVNFLPRSHPAALPRLACGGAGWVSRGSGGGAGPCPGLRARPRPPRRDERAARGPRLPGARPVQAAPPGDGEEPGLGLGAESGDGGRWMDWAQSAARGLSPGRWLLVRCLQITEMPIIKGQSKTLKLVFMKKVYISRPPPFIY